jgi:hypothetical protein
MEISAEMKSERAAGEIWLYFAALARGATFRRQHMNKLFCYSSFHCSSWEIFCIMENPITKSGI